MEAELNSTPTTPTAWQGQAMRALLEAQIMSEVMGSLVSRVIDESTGDGLILFPLEAVRACLMRLDAVVDPAIEAAPAVAAS